MGGCKTESRESRRDHITTGALKLGAIASGEEGLERVRESMRANGVAEEQLLGPTDEMARDTVHFGQELIQLVKRVVAEELEPYAAELQRVALMGEPERARLRGLATQARWDAEVAAAKSEPEGVKEGDRFRRLGGPFVGDEPTVLSVRGESAHCDLGWGEVQIEFLLNASAWQRLPRETAAIAIADTFRWICGDRDGQIGEVTGGPWERENGQSWGLQTGVEQGLFLATVLLDEAFFTRVRAVEQMPTALDRAAASAALRQAIEAPPLSLVGGHEMRVIHESGAAWGGMEPVDPGDDLDGPAGDERAPGLTEAGAAAAGWAVDVAKLRLAWETLKTAANDDITARAEATIDDIIDALALRAGQLRPSRLAGGQ